MRDAFSNVPKSCINTNDALLSIHHLLKVHTDIIKIQILKIQSKRNQNRPRHIIITHIQHTEKHITLH